ncbi:CidA/LrgA family protein [Staphylococcus sp. SQ8-PEA]|uniref:CidA/LrgA family protein n=1 Tax=Staphylococcus marylandisciuri TaxID=2981529 RepID=A0ABT2QN18_9STAP|nr:CidA/LrgA family protein [Staphylococcus marylandisciuri]MCU5745362.1 CidA/LrgA family protein [Staphylococcus marylandisciuri]
MQFAWKVVRTLLQILLLMGITYLGSLIQSICHIPIAGSIVGLILLFLLLQFKIIPEKFVSSGANFFLATMIFYFVPSVVGIMDVASDINLNFIVFFILIIFGTCSVALVSGYIAEKMVKKVHRKEGDN